jgi:hypothetical protein
MEFNEKFQRYLDTLDDDLDNLVLSVMNVCDVRPESEKEFEQIKDYLKNEIEQDIMKFLGKLKRSRIFDRSINEMD